MDAPEHRRSVRRHVLRCSKHSSAERGAPGLRSHATCERSELLRDTGLPQHSICGVPREDLLVHWKASLSDGAVPDFVVSPAGSLKLASVSGENLLHPHREAGHQDARTSLSSCSYRTWYFAGRRAGTPFSSSNSGTRILSFRARLLGESASATRPGISSLSATQTPASLSHRASTSKASREVSCCTLTEVYHGPAVLFRSQDRSLGGFAAVELHRFAERRIGSQFESLLGSSG